MPPSGTPPKPQYPKRRRTDEGPSRRWVYAVVAALVVLAGIAAAVLVLSGDDEVATEPSELTQGLEQDGLVLGDPDAPVTLVEYADLQCPFCRQFALDVLPELVERYVRPGDVKLEFRGLAFIGSDSRKALEHVLAAAEEDKAWDYTDLLYRNQGGENTGWVTDDLLASIATTTGLDPDEVAERAGSSEVDAAIDEEASRASGLGINSTPSFLLGPSDGELEQLQVSALEPGEFVPAIDAALADARG
jgi:protein-disulfide isomerase